MKNFVYDINDQCHHRSVHNISYRLRAAPHHATIVLIIRLLCRGESRQIDIERFHREDRDCFGKAA